MATVVPAISVNLHRVACTAQTPAADKQSRAYFALSSSSNARPVAFRPKAWQIACCQRHTYLSYVPESWQTARQTSLQGPGYRKKGRGNGADMGQGLTCKVLLQDTQDVAVTSEESLLMQKAEEMRTLLQGTSIFLVGMMGSGKTTVGRIVADALGYCFFDSDSLVEQAAGGASVAEIFAENGEEAFREAESQAIAQLSTMVRLVVATGGGAVIRRSNWGRMRDGVTVWLNVPLEALATRLAAAGTHSRPILASGETEGTNGSASHDAYTTALEKLSSIFEERQALYVPADAEVSLQAIAAELGGVPLSSITPTRIALQVLKEIETLIRRRIMEDNARRMT